MAKRIVNLEDNILNSSSNNIKNSSDINPGMLTRLRNIERRKLFSNIAVIGLILLVSIGALAQMGLLPHKDKETGKKYGWFGQELAINATSLWDPFAAAPTTSQQNLQLSKEYVYAGDRLLAIEETGGTPVSTPPDQCKINGVWTECEYYPEPTSTPSYVQQLKLNFGGGTVGSWIAEPHPTNSGLIGGSYVGSNTPANYSSLTNPPPVMVLQNVISNADPNIPVVFTKGGFAANANIDVVNWIYVDSFTGTINFDVGDGRGHTLPISYSSTLNNSNAKRATFTAQADASGVLTLTYSYPSGAYYALSALELNEVGGTSTPTPTPNPGSCSGNFSDDFNDGIINNNLWSHFEVSPGYGSPVSETYGGLVIDGVTHPTQSTYAGYVSKCSAPVVGSTIVTEIVDPTTNNGADGQMSMIGFYNETTSFVIWTFNGYVTYHDQTSLFNPSTDRWVRIRDDVASKTIYFEGSGNGTNWTVRSSFYRGDNYNNYYAPMYLVAGTAAGKSGVNWVRYDNFSYVNINN